MVESICPRIPKREKKTVKPTKTGKILKEGGNVQGSDSFENCQIAFPNKPTANSNLVKTCWAPLERGRKRKGRGNIDVQEGPVFVFFLFLKGKGALTKSSLKEVHMTETL